MEEVFALAGPIAKSIPTRCSFCNDIISSASENICKNTTLAVCHVSIIFTVIRICSDIRLFHTHRRTFHADGLLDHGREVDCSLITVDCFFMLSDSIYAVRFASSRWLLQTKKTR